MTDSPRLIRDRSPGDLPAFPIVLDCLNDRTGMSKREHFASLLLAGMNANPDRATATNLMIQDAIAQADLLIEALNKADRDGE